MRVYMIRQIGTDLYYPFSQTFRGGPENGVKWTDIAIVKKKLQILVRKDLEIVAFDFTEDCVLSRKES